MICSWIGSISLKRCTLTVCTKARILTWKAQVFKHFLPKRPQFPNSGFMELNQWPAPSLSQPSAVGSCICKREGPVASSEEKSAVLLLCS